jgi:hypothetical protein
MPVARHIETRFVIFIGCVSAARLGAACRAPVIVAIDGEAGHLGER